MSKKRRILLMTITLLVVLIVSIAFTTAYLFDVRKVDNVLEFGSIQVEVFGDYWQKETNGKLPKEVIVPDKQYKKDPTIRNIGNIPCYVRVILTVENGSYTNVQDLMKYIQLSDKGQGWKVTQGTWNKDNRIILVYEDVVGANEETSAIMSHFSIRPISTGSNPQAFLEALNGGFDIKVDVQAVQSTVSGESFTSAEEAFNVQWNK